MLFGVWRVFKQGTSKNQAAGRFAIHAAGFNYLNLIIWLIEGLEYNGRRYRKLICGNICWIFDGYQCGQSGTYIYHRAFQNPIEEAKYPLEPRDD